MISHPILSFLKPFIYLTLILHLLSSVTAQVLRNDQICQNNGNYTNNSTYQTNLNALLTNLSINIDSTGFYRASVGQSPNRINALALCRGDIAHSECTSCVQAVANEIRELCPNYRQAMMWYETCMLRYSDASFLDIMDFQPYSISPTIENSMNPDFFMTDLEILLDSIREQAANGNATIKMAAGNRSTTGLERLFALVQCTPNLSTNGCDTCLRSAASQLLYGRIVGMIVGRIRTPSCNVRYETSPFYDQTRIDEILPQYGNGETIGGTNTTRTIIISVVSVVSVLIVVIFVGCFMRKMKSSSLKGDAVEGVIAESLQYDFSIIKAATHDFSEDNKLGQGGFGAVYKGKLSDDKEIAVKRLATGSSQGDLEFKNEVMLLAKLQHRNLVRLLGYSLEGSEKLLVYEFVQNASLDAFIFDWNKRYKIIGGIVRGILYLHEDFRLTIIHRDLKAGNVLLDKDMNPKIAGFGMARLFAPDETHAITRKIAGTYGYMAPEYAMRGHFSVKSDVFSFGVLLLEIISGKKSNCLRYGDTNKDLLSHAWDNWHKGTAANLVDPLLNFGSSIPRDILRCIHIGLLCVQENAVNRPTMVAVITMLNNLSIALPLPSRPAFYVHDDDSENSLLEALNLGEGVSDTISQNEMSISEFQAR